MWTQKPRQEWAKAPLSRLCDISLCSVKAAASGAETLPGFCVSCERKWCTLDAPGCCSMVVWQSAQNR